MKNQKTKKLTLIQKKKIAWFILGFFLTAPAIVLAWVSNVDKQDHEEKIIAIKFSTIGTLLVFILCFIFATVLTICTGAK